MRGVRAYACVCACVARLQAVRTRPRMSRPPRRLSDPRDVSDPAEGKKGYGILSAQGEGQAGKQTPDSGGVGERRTSSAGPSFLQRQNSHSHRMVP